MALHATGPAATGTTRGASARASRSGYVSAPRSRRATPVRAAATETKATEQPKGTVSLGALFGGLPKLGVTGTVQLGNKKKEEKGPAPKGGRDDRVVFVAGSTGRTGARVVRELLDAGFTVRAGARNVEAAEAALNVAAAYGIIKPEQLKRVAVVPFDLDRPAEFEAAIGSANKIVCALGAPEDQALNFSAPKKVDGDGTIALVNKASELGVNQFVLVSSLGTGKLGWPAGVLNLFGGVLLWKREAEKALEASGMAYTIVRPGGMERPTDDYKKTHNLTVKPRDSTFGGQVSRLQVAELVAAACANPAVAENKVLELVAETTAPPVPLDSLMQGISQDISRESQLSNREQVDAARAELAAAQVKASQAAAALLEADKRVAELSARLKEAKATEAAVKKEVAPVLKGAGPLEKQLAEARKAAERAVLLEAASKVVLERARKAAGSGVLLSDKERAAIVDEVLNPKPAAPEKPAAAAAEPRKGSGQIFGFFGKKPEPAGPTEEEVAAAEAAAKAEAEAAAAAAAKASAPAPFFGGFFTPKPAGPSAEERAAAAEAEAAAEAAAAEAEAKAAAAAAAKAKAPAPFFGGFFTPKPAEPEPEPEQEPEPVAPPPPPPAAKKARAVPPPVAVKEEVVVVEEVVVEEAKPAFSFGGFFGGLGKAVVAEPEPAAPEPEAAKPEPHKAVEKVVEEAPKAAAPPPPPAPKPAPPPPAPKPAAPEVDPAVELARRRVVEAAKAKLAAEAAAAAAAAPKPAPPPPPPAPKPVVEAPKPIVAEAPKPVVAEAPKAEAPVAAKKTGDYDEAAAAKNKADAKAWIAAWKAQSKKGAAPAPAGKTEEIPANKAEAQAWIAAWKERSGKGEQPAAAAAESEVVVEENPVAKFFTNLFG
ncbi:hypothetical protein HXX76_005191 [Chlamydomonas incerta]|uniref:NAD(P)-binding domain-containing protein n=1 Tax=Chlamydomonas incerta TaxID=51695 RepID=A0A835W671_CHLIN|nr:hypothetical protein HXX76_005191 [Chlamydomonas incerta]|eukprot:KAG2438644.1 hypothetical protein HXX76_005191 [Chlamydomonas incerta]